MTLVLEKIKAVRYYCIQFFSRLVLLCGLITNKSELFHLLNDSGCSFTGANVFVFDVNLIVKIQRLASVTPSTLMSIFRWILM